MKLELTHLSPYLPYGLKFEYKNEIYKAVGLNTDYHPTVEVRIDDDVARYASIKIVDIKPLLLPMSSLYTEMEDGTIPIVELAKIACPKSNWRLRDSSYYPTDSNKRLFIFDTTKECFVIEYESERGRSYIFVNQLDLFTYLFSHHFDVFSLVDNGLAIDKTKIK